MNAVHQRRKRREEEEEEGGEEEEEEEEEEEGEGVWWWWWGWGGRTMRCHYEVLGVERTPAPDDDVIRRAYRRAALRCHPDKVVSLGDAAAAAAAEEEFKAVQAA